MRSFGCALLLSCLSLLDARGARAQEGVPSTAETEGARALFNQGIEAAAAGDFRTARDRFRAAERLRPAPAIEFNLATALTALGELDEAEELVGKVLANPETPDTVREGATTLGERIRAEGGVLTIAFEGDATDVSIRLDERVLDESRVRGPITVAARAHVVDALRGGEELAREEVTIERGGSASVRLVLPPPEPAEIVAPPPDGGGGGNGGGGDDWVIWAAVGGGVALVVAAVIVIAVLASGTEEPIQGTFQPGVLTW